MAAFANLIGLGSERSKLFAAVSVGIGALVHRVARERYTEQCERIASTGVAGMI